MTRRKLYYLLAGIVGITTFPFLWHGLVSWHYGRQIYLPGDLRPERVAIVFGARI